MEESKLMNIQPNEDSAKTGVIPYPATQCRKNRLIDRLTKLYLEKDDHPNINKYRNSEFSLHDNERHSSKRSKRFSYNQFDPKDRVHFQGSPYRLK